MCIQKDTPLFINIIFTTYKTKKSNFFQNIPLFKSMIIFFTILQFTLAISFFLCYYIENAKRKGVYMLFFKKKKKDNNIDIVQDLSITFDNETQTYNIIMLNDRRKVQIKKAKDNEIILKTCYKKQGRPKKI